MEPDALPQTAPASAGLRALARQYDQQLRSVASHFDNNGNGRADSAAYLAAYFHELVGLSRPHLFVEAGAYRADASRRVRADYPDCRVVAFEANPHNHAKYVDELGFVELGVEYVNLAVTDAVGFATFNLRTSEHGRELRPDTGNSSLLRRSADGMTYEEVTIPTTSLDVFFANAGHGVEQPVCLWVDVEGASRGVLEGGSAILDRTDVLLIEVEEHQMWQGQWCSLDVLAHLLGHGFLPVSRDVEFPGQYNLLFVKDRFYDRPEVLLSLELHLNYLVQRMGMPPTTAPTPVMAVPSPGSSPGTERGWRGLTGRLRGVCP